MKISSIATVVMLLVVAHPGVAPHAQAQGGIPLWTNRYHGPTNSYAAGMTMAVDKNGNVIVTGSSAGNGSGIDYATIKYSGAGVPLWTNRYSGPGYGDDLPAAIAVDSSGNVFVTGYTTAPGAFYDTDYATIKYSSAGVPLWTNRYNGPWTFDDGGNPADSASSIAVDNNGNVFVTGTSVGNGTVYDYATIKYSNSGMPLWTNRYNGPAYSTDIATGVAVDSAGNVFVTGYSLDNVTDDDYVTIKYSNAGIPLWTNRYDGGAHSHDFATSLAVDSSGNVFVTGASDSVGDPDFNLYDFATIKYSGAGVPLWTNRYLSPGYDTAYANALAVDAQGNVFVTGYIDDTTPGYVQSRNFATVAYSSAGVPLWTNRYNGSDGLDEARSVAVDNSGHVFVTGYSYDFNGINSDFITIAYSEASAPLWTNRFHGPLGYNNLGNSMVVDSSGNVLVTGWSQTATNGTDGDFVTIKYSAISPPALSLSIRLTTTNTVTVSWPSAATGFVLQQNTNALGTVNWSNVVGTIQSNATTRFIIVNPPAGNCFYRLVQQ